MARLSSGCAVDPSSQGPSKTATRLEATARGTQNAFGEWDARSCDRAELCAFAVRLARFAPHPFARSGDDIPVTGMRPARATPRTLGSVSRPRHRAREEDASSVHLCNRPETRAPVNPFESRAVGLAPTNHPRSILLRTSCDARSGPRSSRGARPAPLRGRIEPQVDTRLTAPVELRLGSFTRPDPAFRDRAGRRPVRTASPHRGVIDHVRG